MSFAQPLMLLGALAALLPLLIHLFDRRRPRPVPFGAISFVLRSQKRTASRLKLRRLILYALRTLILLAIPIALARPELRQPAQAAALARGPAATSIIFDTSLSMRYQLGNPSLFERGKALARDALKDLRPEEPANVVLCGPGAAPPGAPAFDRGRLREAIDEAQVSYQGADLNRCLELAARSLEESPLPGKRLVVVSDLTQTSLKLDAPAPTVRGPNGQMVRPDVVLRDAAEGEEVLPNRAVVDLKIEPALQAGPRTFQFTITVRNFSPEAVQDVEAALVMGERVVTKGFVEVGPNGTAQKILTWRFEDGGTYAGEVRLTPDALAEDDRRPFVLQVPKELRALVVNGEPHAVRYRDEAFFVDAALGAQGSPVRQSTRDPAAAWREDLAQYDLLFLLNAPAPDAETAARLTAFVEDGGGLFVSMGDRVEPEAYNERLGKLLPRPLRLVKTAALPGEEGAEQRAARLGDVTLEHAIFSPFTGQAGEGLVSARFYKYMLLEAEQAGGADGSSRVLATFDDGAPAFAVRRFGKGRVVMFTSTVDRDWADLAIRTSFLPLMQRTSSYLTGSLDERESMRVRVGTTLSLRPQNPIGEVKSPSGKAVPVKVQEDGSAVVGPMAEPGIHSVTSNGQPVPELAFAAVLDPGESDLSRLEEDALNAWFGEATVTHGEGPDGDRPKVPLWTWLISIAAVAFFFEGVLLRK